MNGPDITIDLRSAWESPDALLYKEWLVTNGLGGYASGTLSGDLSRRYHGLFLPNLANPKGRHLMISRLIEEIIVSDRHVRIGQAIGLCKPQDLQALQSFTMQGNVARWCYAVGDVVIEKSLLMPHAQNTVCVRYAVLSGAACKLRLQPYFSFRRQDAPLIRPGMREFSLTLLDQRIEVACAGQSLSTRLALRPHTGVFVCDPHELQHALLREQRRGQDWEESARSLGYYEFTLTSAEPITLIATTHSHERLEFDIDATFRAELDRLAPIVRTRFANDAFGARLAHAADQFLALPANRIEDSLIAQARGHELRTVMAGYHWFADWGRDTMISLEGLMLSTGRHAEARATLHTFASYVADGLLPNLFPEGERVGLYHTVDATLWYFHALHRYLINTGDTPLMRELLPVLQAILQHHVIGTRFGIHMDEQDGLISASAEGYQLTWMDAKVDGWVVTPRRGKPVEIQALWYNALRLMHDWTPEGELRDSYDRLAKKAYDSFNAKFWNAELRCLHDVIDGPVGANGIDTSLRPNQMFAISLDYPILERKRWESVMSIITTKLLTPYGLRTLSPDHPDYKPTYHGDLRSRDAAYHQGTVWPWLIGHYIEAQLKLGHKGTHAEQLLSAFVDHLTQAGIGSISEIFDAEPPHAPHGCIAQAWSVAEVLRAWLLIRGKSASTTSDSRLSA